MKGGDANGAKECIVSSEPGARSERRSGLLLLNRQFHWLLRVLSKHVAEGIAKPRSFDADSRLTASCPLFLKWSAL